MGLEIHNFVSRGQIALEPGDLVDQTDDLGEVHRRVVKYAPWQLGNGTWLIGLVGIAGGYALCRCQPAAIVSPSGVPV